MMNTTTSIQPTDASCSHTPAEAAPTTMLASFELLRAEIQSVADDDLVALNLDVKACVATVLSALPAIRSVRDAIVVELPRFDLVRFDRLEDYAQALGHLQYEFERAEDPVPELPAYYAQALVVRDELLVAGNALVKFGIIQSALFKSSSGNAGYTEVGYEICRLARTLLEKWPSLEGRSPITKEQLEHAYALGDRLVLDAAVRARAPQQSALAAKERLRAFTRLVHVYSDARRAITCVRWFDGDADAIAPSLYAGRGTGNASKRSSKDAPGAEPSADPTPPPAAAPANPTQPTESATPAAAVTSLRPKGDSIFVPASAEPFVTR